MRRSIVWFRNDLRIHDNEALVDALAHNDEILPLYIIDPRIFNGFTSYGFPKAGSFRINFILESLIDLRNNLKDIGSNLYVRVGHPEEIIPQLARELKTSYVYCNRERTKEEVDVQDALEKGLWSIGQEVRYYRGKMLYYTADLPFPVTHCPDSFTSFRKEVEKFVQIRKPLDSPAGISSLSIELDEGPIPALSDFDFDTSATSQMLRGGENAAIEELNYYLWDSDLIANYKETRNQLIGREYSSKLSSSSCCGGISFDLWPRSMVT